MAMPQQLSKPVQRALRPMISGIILVQCFTVYVYLASYIVLLYPVFLEERPTLVLPWLLLTAIRKLLCELTSLTLGLGICLLVGTSRAPCVKFLINKFMTIMPAFYMWTLVYSYYNTLKVASAFKTFPALLPESGLDYGLELAVRRRRTKSLFGEEQLRKKIVSGQYSDEPPVIIDNLTSPNLNDTELNENSSSETSIEGAPLYCIDSIKRSSIGGLNKYAGLPIEEDGFGIEINIPRGDRVLEQFVVMLLKIGTYLNSEGSEFMNTSLFKTSTAWGRSQNLEAIPSVLCETPSLVGRIKENTASYLRDYPQIFMKKSGTDNSKVGQNRRKEVSGSKIRRTTQKTGTLLNDNDTITSIQVKTKRDTKTIDETVDKTDISRDASKLICLKIESKAPSLRLSGIYEKQISFDQAQVTERLDDSVELVIENDPIEVIEIKAVVIKESDENITKVNNDVSKQTKIEHEEEQKTDGVEIIENNEESNLPGTSQQKDSVKDHQVKKSDK